MTANIAGLLAGTGFGFLLAWGGLTDPQVIRQMLLLRESHVFLVMGSAVGVAALGVRLLRFAGARALITGEPIAWTISRPRANHVVGSVIFGAGWSLAGTCPGPLAAMIGQGRLSGFLIVTGLMAGAALQSALRPVPLDTRASAPAGL